MTLFNKSSKSYPSLSMIFESLTSAEFNKKITEVKHKKACYMEKVTINLFHRKVRLAAYLTSGLFLFGL